MFTEAFFAESTSPLVKKFVKKYRETYNENPGAMEALAYDAASLLELAVSSGVTSRAEFRDYLRNVTNFPGITGRISYKDGTFARNVTVLTVHKGQITEAPKNGPESKTAEAAKSGS